MSTAVHQLESSNLRRRCQRTQSRRKRTSRWWSRFRSSPSPGLLTNRASQGISVAPRYLRLSGYGNEVEPDARYENGGNRNERQVRARRRKLKGKDRALVLAEELLHPLKRDWIDVPGISGNVSHAAHSTVARCMKPVVHARPETKGNELAAAVPFDESLILQQIHQAIGEALCLNGLSFLDRSERSDDRVTGTGNDAWIRIDRPGARLEARARSNPEGSQSPESSLPRVGDRRKRRQAATEILVRRRLRIRLNQPIRSVA